MKNIPCTIELSITGLGIILYSPSSVAAIKIGENYLTKHYQDPDQVAEHIQRGSIVGFCTGSSGDFRLHFLPGYPSQEQLNQHELCIRLAIQVDHGHICVRDLYDLMQWNPDCSDSQRIALKDGIYHLTLCTNADTPGDDQEILIFVDPLNEFPKLMWTGVPMLCN